MSSFALEINQIIPEIDVLLDGSGLDSIASAISIMEFNGIEIIFQNVQSFLEKMTTRKLKASYEELLELTAEIIAILYEEDAPLNLDFPDLPEIGHDDDENIRQALAYIVCVKYVIQSLVENEAKSHKKNQFLSLIEDKKKKLNKGFFYEFTEGDLEKTQKLINELREEITHSNLFENNHRARLLKRLEALQAEMHKKMSDVDKIWGLVGDAGIVIGKFGKDAKPFVDRIKELSQIAWKTQARAEELPSSSQNPLLESHSE